MKMKKLDKIFAAFLRYLLSWHYFTLWFVAVFGFTFGSAFKGDFLVGIICWFIAYGFGFIFFMKWMAQVIETIFKGILEVEKVEE